jgi:DNA polymerase epsilon subunit 3
VSASDVLKALEMLDLGDMGPMLQTELQGIPTACAFYIQLLTLPLAYRDHQKTDKTKRGGSKGKPKEALESASAKTKGKAKASSSTTITIPGRSAPSRPAPTEQGPADTADEDMETAEAGVEDEDEEMVDAQDDEGLDDRQEDDVGDEDEDEGEELADEAGFEEEALRDDVRGVEGRRREIQDYD